MAFSFSRLTLNQRLALLAFVLGLIALGAAPTRQGRGSVDPRALALEVQRETDHVTARTVADHLLQGRIDYRLIDVRSPAAYAAYHLPTAENIPIAVLAGADLARNEKLVLYADDGVHAAQAWFLLKAQGYKGVYMLRGGLAEWRSQVLSPELSGGSTPEARREDERAAAVAAHFGGVPRAAGGQASRPALLPPPALVAPAPAAARAPAAPPAPPASRPRAAARKREGC